MAQRSAVVHVESQVRNEDSKPRTFRLFAKLVSPTNHIYAFMSGESVTLQPGETRVVSIEKKQTGQGIQWLADWLNQRSGKASCVVIDGRNGVDVLVEKITGKDGTWKAKNSVIRPGVRDVIASVSVLTDALAGETVTWYELQEELNDSAMTAIKRPIGGGWGFGGENSAPIEAAALALWGAKTSKRDPNRKMRIG